MLFQLAVAQHDYQHHQKKEPEKKSEKPVQPKKEQPKKRQLPDTLKNVFSSPTTDSLNVPKNEIITEKGISCDTTCKEEQPHAHHYSVMPHSFSRNLPMNRNSSGTSWLPDKTPVYGYMKHYKNWSLMGHGSLFLRYTNQDVTNKGSRGDSQLDAPNWFMGMATRTIGKKGLFSFKSMFSFDYFTEGGAGYPLLFQTGETWKGEPLVDRQHPHDLFSELSVAYSQSFTENVDLFGYFGFPGEPALGPPAFMHRVSAMNNPDAPLGHHWQDATHISFGVSTIGFRYKIFKIEASKFNGTEPDENRLDFDRMQFNSHSYRLSLNPTREVALQFSEGFLKSPERHEPGVDIKRRTVSLIHILPITDDNYITSSLVWGANTKEEGTDNSYLVESVFQFLKTGIYYRYEYIQKSAHELHLHEIEEETFNISAFTLGVNRILFSKYRTDLTGGIQGTINFIDTSLENIYGNNPLATQVYLRLNPSKLKL